MEKNQVKKEEAAKVELVKSKKGLRDVCVECTRKALGLEGDFLKLTAKAALAKVREIAPKLESRVATRWNRVEVLEGETHHEFWRCTCCGRAVPTGKSTLPSDAAMKELFTKVDEAEEEPAAE